jgi:hypothetical protein
MENKVKRTETYNHHMNDKINTSTFQVIMIWYCKLMISDKPHIPQGPNMATQRLVWGKNCNVNMFN